MGLEKDDIILYAQPREQSSGIYLVDLFYTVADK